MFLALGKGAFESFLASWQNHEIFLATFSFWSGLPLPSFSYWKRITCPESSSCFIPKAVTSFSHYTKLVLFITVAVTHHRNQSIYIGQFSQRFLAYIHLSSLPGELLFEFAKYKKYLLQPQKYNYKWWSHWAQTNYM